MFIIHSNRAATDWSCGTKKWLWIVSSYILVVIFDIFVHLCNTRIYAIIRRIYTLVEAACSDILHGQAPPRGNFTAGTATVQHVYRHRLPRPLYHNPSNRVMAIAPKPRMQNATDLRAPNCYRSLHADPTIERPVYYIGICKYRDQWGLLLHIWSADKEKYWKSCKKTL